jgi:hypothetical protein
MRCLWPVSSIVSVLVLVGGSACGDGRPTEPDPDPQAERYEIVFSAAPLRLEDLVAITPLGSLNPPDHTIPNDHIAFLYEVACPCDLSPRPVHAPADGTVRLVLRGQDDGLEVGAPAEVAGSELEPWYYMGHVMLFPDIQVGRRITAGEQIGVTGPYALGVDLGVVHPEAENYFVVRARYHAKALFGEKPLRFFTEPLRSQLYALVRREGADKDGKFDYDIAGWLTGGWFHESLPADNRSSGPDGWSRNLAFVYWHEQPDVPVVVVGGTILPPLVYWIAEDDPAFGDVSVATGAVAYRLHNARPLPMLPASPDHIMLVQLLSGTRLMVEVFPASVSPVEFTAQAAVFLR